MWFCPKVGVASKNLRALGTQEYTTTILLEIPDPPLESITSVMQIASEDKAVRKSSANPKC